ncbi:hypothetical protein Arub01_18600 [Actinomadura rubrobrunea]|uniref:DUF4097 domain-containing protein n=1 Tax=Actinomadura rubrobrunea TaxID=115335 RepID=A0A9W6UTG6_9ACTN|nr:DUF4097 family beta strand repeat-containing protein [Actinomadura rubrobrunea]GLW63616.1 hypothetical protein Arub01_18600 [Actinomadura rubrobrunea]
MNSATGTALAAAGAAAAAALALGGCSVDFGVHTETRSYDVREDVTAVRLTSDGGRVEIVGSDAPGIAVQERLRWSNSRNKPRPRHSVADGTLTLSSSCGHTIIGGGACEIAYRVRVPRGLALQVTTDDGAISASGLNGRLTLRTGNGPITVRHLRAPALSAHTDSGAIRVSGRAETADLRTDTGTIQAAALQAARLTAHTQDGRIHLTGRADTADLQTDSGGIDATALASRRLTARTADGTVRIALSTPPDSVRARTDSAAVRLTLPASHSYAVTLESQEGSRRISPAVHQDNRSPRTVVVTTNDGSITVDAA